MSDEKKPKNPLGKWEGKGLKMHRGSSDKNPEFSCNNCKCKRYVPCGCMRKE